MAGAILEGTSRVAILKRWARVFPNQPLPEQGKLPFMAAVKLEAEDPELAEVLSASQLPAALEIQLQEGTWPDAPNPESLPAAAAAQRAAQEQDTLRGLEEAAAAMRARRPSEADMAAQHQQLAESRRRGRDLALAQNQAAFRAVCGLQ